MCGALMPGNGQELIEFDAATIKLDQPGPGQRGMRGGPGTDDPGRVTWQKTWLQNLVATAFHLDRRNVSGPAWIGVNGGQLYAFAATMPDGTSRHDFELMLQKFLIEQFRMKLHHELRPFPTYELVVAAGGTKIKPTDPNAPVGPVRLLGQMPLDSDGFAILPPGHAVVGVFNSGLHVTFQQYTMSELAEYLTGEATPQGDATHYVFDKTGLTGGFDFKLKFDQGGDAIRVGPGVEGSAGARGELEPSGLTNIFKALEQQLGLKLVKGKDIQLDTIVIDHAERTPAGN